MGAVNCAFSSVGKLAAQLKTRFQGQAVCIRDEPAAMKETRSIVRFEFRAQFELSLNYLSFVRAWRSDGLARGRSISLVLRPPCWNDVISCVGFDWRQHGNDDDDDGLLIAGYSMLSDVSLQ